MSHDVMRLSDVGLAPLVDFFTPYALRLEAQDDGRNIPGSYWGDSEAGLIADVLYVRCDTPIHSVLHEAAHFVCMDTVRRETLQQDAGGDHAEENAVCYLQILWSDAIPGFGHERMFRDMDAWGYTFRLGSSRRWFEEDATDARQWLEREGIIDTHGRTTGQRRR